MLKGQKPQDSYAWLYPVLNAGSDTQQVFKKLINEWKWSPALTKVELVSEITTLSRMFAVSLLTADFY